MTIEEFNALSAEELAKDFDTYLARLYEEDNEYEENVLKWMKEFDMEHEIFDRQDKAVGEEGNTKIVEVAKLGVPFQKKIVNTATSFIFGKPVNLINESEEESLEDSFKAFTKAWKDAKLDYHNRRLARRLFVETRVAELFYIRAYESGEGDKKGITQKKLKVMLLCKENGDSLYPVWDALGDMSGFIRKYQVEIEVEAEKKKVDRVEIYTAAWNYTCTKGDDWEIVKYENVFGKIPVIYYEQEVAEWADVQSLIDRVEMMVSKNADTNDYFGAPAIVAKGDLENAPEKNDVGKFFEIKPTISEGRAVFGDLSYLTWDMAPEAIKQEYEILKDLIYSQTSTPDLSFNNVKGTTNLSGIALKFMFFDSILKANNKQEIFGEGLDRRNNLLKEMLSKADVKNNANMTNLEIEVEFAEVLPENVQEMVETLVTASGGGAIMSRETAVRNNPLVEDAEAEVTNLEAEDKKAAEIPEGYGFQTD
jgi:SPP1 family phage portal protein